MTLDQVDRDIFTGYCHAGAPLRAYGGQIAAQALNAAAHTVEPDRHVHSLHGYFLRPGRTKDSIVYLVDRPRDGRSFSTRFVTAVQQGETIFVMTASFTAPDHGPEHEFAMPAAPAPMSVDAVAVPPPSYGDPPVDPGDLGYPASDVIGLRIVDVDEPVRRIEGRYERLAWVRVEEELTDDWRVQTGALTYLSDLTMVSTAMAPHNDQVRLGELMVASIDHAIWFHAPARADRWLLFAQDTPFAGHGRGLARGLFFDQSGTLVASVVQESLLRSRRA